MVDKMCIYGKIDSGTKLNKGVYMLHIIMGSMRAGKSASLIDYTEFLKDKKYKIFFPASCNKEDGYVVSREDNKKAKAIKIFEISDLYNHVNGLDTVLIDEVQFLCGSYQIDELMKFLEYCDKKCIDVYCFGLQVDYLSRAFDVTQRLLPYADSVVVLTAKCDYCGNKASRCLRIVEGNIDSSEDSDLIVMEGLNVEYKSVCRDCYRELTGLSAIK